MRFLFLIFTFFSISSQLEELLTSSGNEGSGISEVLIPTINWESLFENLPTLPPLVLPTIDPNFWQNLPTLPPLVLPTIDPNFWQNLPTLPPLVLPTIDPNFWQNLPTLPPLQLPTIDPDFWKNIPTMSPIVLPTIDPNFWQNLVTIPSIALPTIGPNFWNNLFSLPTIDPNFLNNLPTISPLTFPTFPPFVFPTPTPKTSQCVYKLSRSIKSNDDFGKSLNYTNIQDVIDKIQNQTTFICNSEQSEKIDNLILKYSGLINDIQDIAQYFTENELKKLFVNILDGDSLAVFQLFFSKSLENLANSQLQPKISKVSTQISLLQFDLAIGQI